MSLTTQFYTMLSMIGMGVWLGAALDTYHRFLLRRKRKKIIVFFNDILFWIVQGLLFFLALMAVNEGELRIYIFLAILCGYAAYQSLIQSMYKSLLDKTISLCIKLARFTYRVFMVIIVKPIQFLYKLIIMILMGLWGILLVILRVLWQIIRVLLKILFTPIKWLGILLWRLLPKKGKLFLAKVSHSYKKMLSFFKKIFGRLSILLKRK